MPRPFMLRTLAALGVLTGAAVFIGATSTPHRAEPRSSAWWLGALPDGQEKRKFILDCTGCHQFDEARVLVNGAARPFARWNEDVNRMLGFAGASTGFPVIAAGRHAQETALWLTQALSRNNTTRPEPVAAARTLVDSARIDEYTMPFDKDLPHDVAVDSSGRVIITGMMSHTMYTLDPATGRLDEVKLPVERGGPRAVEVDKAGNWWVLLGAARRLARYEPRAAKWDTWPIDMYPHSIGIADNGQIWYNGHFTRDPELIAELNPASGQTTKHELPPHPALRSNGGPVPYELRLAPDGKVWMSELQGNRMISFDPGTRQTRVYELATSWSGPRRFDIDADGILWIPAYSANQLVRLDPKTGVQKAYQLPVPDAVPYVARVDFGTRQIWLGTSAADAMLRFDPATERWRVYPLPSRGALVRHLAIDPRTHDVWIAYGASPSAIPAKIARLRAR
jgi:virginiamycin B lyase